jgi:hypothetical protein
MSRGLPLLVGILACAMLAFGCGDGSSPAAPTPTATAPPPPPPPPPPPAEPAALASLSLEPSTIASQGNPIGTVTLTAAAPAEGAVVSLSSGNTEVARVPGTVTIAAGATSNTFRIETSTVSSASLVTIIATYAGQTRTAPLTVLAPALEPRFTVRSNNRGDDTCDIVDANGAIDCEFNASTSSGFVARYLWTMRLGGTEFSFTAQDNQAVVTPMTTCGFLGNGTAEDGKLVIEVTLQLEDRSGNRSGTARRTISVFHNSRCGHT